MRKSVVFLVDPGKPWGSNLLRGEQLCKIASWTLAETGLSFWVQAYNTDVHDAILFCAKTAVISLSPERIADLKEKGNVLCADVLDLTLRGADFSAYDFLVSCSILQTNNFKQRYPHKPIFHVTHHVDIRIPDAARRPDAFSAAFIGSLATGFEIKQLAGLLAIIESDPVNTKWIGELARHNLHYSVRAPTIGWDGFKPFTKGFIAAHFGAPILVSKDDEEAMIYLGADYPFACDHTLEAVRDMLAFAKNSFGNDLWKQAELQMRRVKEKSLPKVVIAELRALFEAAKAA